MNNFLTHIQLFTYCYAVACGLTLAFVGLLHPEWLFPAPTTHSAESLVCTIAGSLFLATFALLNLFRFIANRSKS
jgi:hypothetical protein